MRRSNSRATYGYFALRFIVFTPCLPSQPQDWLFVGCGQHESPVCDSEPLTISDEQMACLSRMMADATHPNDSSHYTAPRSVVCGTTDSLAQRP